MNPIVYLLDLLLNLAYYLTLAWVIVSMLISFRVLDRTSLIVTRIDDFLSRLVEPMLKPIRKYVPPINGIDISPLVLIIAILVLQYTLFWFVTRY